MLQRRFLFGLILFLAGCTGASTGTPSSPSSDDAPRSPQPPARITVTQIWSGGSFFTEGSISYLTLIRGDEIVFRRRFRKAPLYRPLIDDRSLEPGRYRLVSYQRPCDGSCQALDPPRARCATTLDLGSDNRLVVTIELNIPKPCTMLLQPAAEVGRAYRFDLSTHCGFGVTFFDGKTWVARGTRKEAINPPPGWGDPFKRGSMQLISPRELEFTSGSGETIQYGLPPPGSPIQFSLCY